MGSYSAPPMVTVGSLAQLLVAKAAPVHRTLPPGLRVLCLDNDAAILDAFDAALRSRRCVPLLAATIDEAMTLAADEEPDVALIDFHLDAAEDGGGTILRLYETAGRQTAVKVEIPVLNVAFRAEFKPQEIKTYLIPDGSAEAREVNFLEW